MASLRLCEPIAPLREALFARGGFHARARSFREDAKASVGGLRSRWPWALLLLAMAWVALARVPLILNAEAHLDSDLAVDGLTLLDATRGRWRWHYPGTPHMGIG